MYEELISRLNRYTESCVANKLDADFADAVQQAANAIEELTDRNVGKWIDDGLDGIGVMGIEYRWQKCSECGETFSKAPGMAYPKYCSQCGAKMEFEEGEE